MRRSGRTRRRAGDAPPPGVAGLRRHVAFYPHSGRIIARVADRLTARGNARSRGAITTPFDRALLDRALDEVIRQRRAEIAPA